MKISQTDTLLSMLRKGSITHMDAILSPKTLHSLLRHDVEGGLLYWRNRSARFFTEGKRSAQSNANIWNGRYAGTLAMHCIGNHGYRTGAIFDQKYLAHRVIWAMVHGCWPLGQIDHIDGNRTRNIMSNMRDIAGKENQKNMKLRADNASGICGVLWDKSRRKWVAQISSNGQHFNLGRFVEKSDAIAARSAAEVKYGFHENHGRASNDQKH